MTTTKNISTFKRYVNWILDQFMNSIADYDSFEDSTLWNVRVVYQAHELKLNRNDSLEKLAEIVKNPAVTDSWSNKLLTPDIEMLVDRGVNIKSYFDIKYFEINELQMTPWQTYELCKILLFDMICSDFEHGFRHGINKDDYEEYINTNLHMFSFLAYHYSDSLCPPELFLRAKRLVKSLNKKYVEIMTL